MWVAGLEKGVKMKIAIITSFREVCTEEDFVIAKSFAEDGHHVDLLDFPLNFPVEKYYDLIIFKNAWYLSEDKVEKFFEDEFQLMQKIEKTNCKIVCSNDGKLLFNTIGKKYLADLFKQGFNVVPTINDMKDIDLLPKVEKYIKKPFVSYEGFGMEVVSKEDLKNLELKNEILQPKVDFISEVQLYFINNDYQYAMEYTPHKWPDYPTPHMFSPTQKYIDEAKRIMELNGASCSIGRVDFLRVNKDEMQILEFADTCPNMNLLMVDKDTLKKFLKNFKEAVYKYVKS